MTKRIAWIAILVGMVEVKRGLSTYRARLPNRVSYHFSSKCILYLAPRSIAHEALQLLQPQLTGHNVCHASHVARRHQDRGLLRERPQDVRGNAHFTTSPRQSHGFQLLTLVPRNRTFWPFAPPATTISRPSTA